MIEVFSGEVNGDSIGSVEVGVKKEVEKAGEEGGSRADSGGEGGGFKVSGGKRGFAGGGYDDMVLESRVSNNWGSEVGDLEACSEVSWRRGELKDDEGFGNIGKFFDRSISEGGGGPGSVRDLLAGVPLPVAVPSISADVAPGWRAPSGEARLGSAKVSPFLSSVNVCGVSAIRDFGPCTTVFVNNIPPSVTAMRLKEWFAHFGSIVDVFISKKMSKFRGCCFAFVRFRYECDAWQACEISDGSTFEGFVLEVNISKFPRGVSYSCVDILQEKKEVGGKGSCNAFGGLSSVLPVSSSAGRLPAVGVCPPGLRSSFGVSFAQILKSGRISDGVKSERLVGCLGAGDEAKAPMISIEDPDHLKAIMCNIQGCDGESVRPSLMRTDVFLLSEITNPCRYLGLNGDSMDSKFTAAGVVGEVKFDQEVVLSKNSNQEYVIKDDKSACPSGVLACTQFEDDPEVTKG